MNKKIVFVGPTGVGKSSTIKLLSERSLVNTDEKATDHTRNIKPTTTVAMDYGVMTLTNGKRVHLYGTPGQERFDFMWEILATGCDGVVILIDNSRANPLQDLRFYAGHFREYAANNKLVVGVTKSDIEKTLSLEKYHAELEELDLKPVVHMVDARCHGCVRQLVDTLVRCEPELSVVA